MNGLDHRMKRIEEAANNAGGRRVCFCFVEPDEDEKENGQEDVEVFTVSWANETTWPP